MASEEKIVLVNKDWREQIDRIRDEKPALILTDPPYHDIEMYREILDTFLAGKNLQIILFKDPRVNLGLGSDEVQFWVKETSTKNFQKNCGNFVEEIMIWRNYDICAFNPLHWSQMTGVHTDKLVLRETLHPAQKPITLLERLIGIYSYRGDTVVDLCAGSFGTAIACSNLRRNFLGFEIDNDTWEVGVQRVRMSARVWTQSIVWEGRTDK